MICIEGTLFALLIISYFYLRGRLPEWPVYKPPALFWGTLNTLVLLASAIPNQLTKSAAERHDLGGVRLWIVVSLFAAIAFGLIRIFEFRALNERARLSSGWSKRPGQGHRVSHQWVVEALRDLGYSLQGNRKVREGGDHPDRDAQFAHINTAAATFLAADDPAISVVTKKKELVGDFKNSGREWRPKGTPEAVRVHDFLIKELGRAVPYGVYDLAANAGWVSVGLDHDTAAFAVQTIRR